MSCVKLTIRLASHNIKERYWFQSVKNPKKISVLSLPNYRKMAVSNLSNLKNVGFKFVCVAQTSLSQLNLSVDDGEPHPLSSKTGFGPTLRYIGDIFPTTVELLFILT